MNQREVFNVKDGVTRRVYRRGESRDEPTDRYTVADCVVTVDVTRLADELGARALYSKSGRAQDAHGAVTVEVVNRRVLPCGTAP